MTNPEKKTRRRRYRRLLFAVAPAAVVLIAGLLYFLFQTNAAGSMLSQAQSCMEGGEYGAAADLYEAFLERYPERVESIAAPYTRALQELPEARAERARTILQRQALTENAHAWFFFGFVCARARDTAGAVAAYETVIHLNPDFTESYFNLGHIYAQEKKFPEAEAMFRKVVALAPAYSDEALYNLAVILGLQGKKEQCAQYLRRALSANPRNEKAQAYLVKLGKAGP